MKKENILFINYYFSPIRAIGSVRNSKLAKYIALKNWDVSVLTTSNNRLFEKEEILGKYKKKINKRNIFTFDYQTIKFILLRINRLFKKQGVAFNAFKRSSEMSLLKVLNLFPFNLLIGEGGLIYIILSFLKALYLIKKKSIKYVYTSYSPFSDIFIGYLLKTIIPDIKWVADFRDLHLSGFKENFLVKMTRFIDKIILRKADVVTTVSDGLGKGLKEYNSSIYILRNGFDLDDVELDKNEIKIKDFSFLYVGALYGEKRDPGILFHSIETLINGKKIKSSNVRMIYAGREGNIFLKTADKYNLKSVSKDIGFIKRQKSLKLQKESCYLIMITWSNKEEKGIISGKFYEYLSSGRPIICIVRGIRDPEIDKIFKMTNAGIVVYTNNRRSEKDLEKYLLAGYKKYMKKNYKNNYNWDEINKFSYNNLADEFIKLIKNIR